MRNLTIYLTTFLCLSLTTLFAQTFEDRAKEIAVKIEAIAKEEKEALKSDIEAVNVQLEKGAITNVQADEKKLQLAQTRAKNIEFRTAQVESELRDLIQQKVDGKITEKDSAKRYSLGFPGGYKDHEHKKKEKENGEPRTTSQFVFAFGVNNLVTNNTVAHSDFRFWGSHFYELGMTHNTRILKNNNLLHAKYGVSLMYNNLRPTENRMFTTAGSQTVLVTSPIHLEDSRFRNVYIVVPVHLEFDFSGSCTKGDKTTYCTHQSFRFGLGGYAGANLKSKQILDYEANGNDVSQQTKGDFNVNDFIYGVSAYIGFKELSLYAKYDLNPLFTENVVNQNNISMGLRFDFN